MSEVKEKKTPFSFYFQAIFYFKKNIVCDLFYLICSEKSYSLGNVCGLQGGK